MIEFFSAILGFGAPFLPELLKYFNRKQDNAHELSMMSLQAQLAEKQHTNEFKRHDPLVIGLGASLGVTDTELDNLFKLAATL